MLFQFKLLCIVMFFTQGVMAYHSSSSNSRTHHANTDITVQIPNRLEVGDKLYEGNIDGLGEYMTDLKKSNQDVYNKLEPKFNELKYKDKLGTTILWGGAITSILLVAYATKLYFDADDIPGHSDPGHPNFMQHDKSKIRDSKIFAITGGFFFLGTFVAGNMIAPKRVDYFNFINDHNEQNSEHKMKWKIGFQIFEKNRPGVLLMASF